MTADFSAHAVTLKNNTSLLPKGKVYAFYPSSAFYSVVEADNAVRVNLKLNQTPAAVDTFDPAADILVGKPNGYNYDGDNLGAEIAFGRVMSVVKISLQAGAECPENLAVNKLTMTAPEGSILTGRVKLSLDALYGDASPLSDWTVKNNAVSANYNEMKPIIGGSANTVYLIVNPTPIAAGNITFTIDTDNYTIEKTVSLSKALTFPQGNVANIGLTISSANCTPKVAETRILVEKFDNVTTTESQATPSQTGAAGTGVSNALEYTYSTKNTNVRINSNGHGNENPFLWISGENQYLQASNIVVSGETVLKFSCQTRTTQSTAKITLKYKESTAETWNSASGEISATTSSIDNVQSLVFTISEEATSLDLQIVGSAGNLVVDDIVLEKYVEPSAQVATGNASGISASGATIAASYCDANARPSNAFIKYGTSTANLSATAEYSDALPSGAGNFSVTLSGLTQNTTYYYKAVVQFDTKTFEGSVLSFTTTQPSLPDGWLELPSRENVASLFYDNFGTGSTRNYSYCYDTGIYASLWTAYPLTYSHTQGQGSNSDWNWNPNLDHSLQVNIVSGAYEKNYGNGDYARGHMCPNADRKSDNTQNRQTYYPTNQLPQIQNKFNSGIWSTLEKEVRGLLTGTDTVYIAVGPCYRKIGGNETVNHLTATNETIIPQTVDIPNYFYKVLLKVKWNANTVSAASAIGFWLENRAYDNSDFTPYAVSVDQIEAWTGIDFFSNLPDALEAIAEENSSWSDFTSF